MRSRVIVKCRELFGYYYEKIMEWFYSIRCRIVPTRREGSSLVEEYLIYEHYAGEQYVKDFITERTRNSIMNKYCIKIRSVCNDNDITDMEKDTETIGKVRLMRKKTIIDEATLIIKKNERNIIYWKFNNL